MSNVKVALLLSYICIASISAAIITPALPAIQHTFSLGHDALQWVVSIFLVGYVVGQLVYGPVANRYGRLVALRSGLIINLIGIAICLIAAWVNSYSLLLLGRLVTALGASAGLVCTFLLIKELLDDERAKMAMSYAILSFTLGTGLAILIGGLVTQYLGWQQCFWVLAIHGVLMLILTWQFEESLTQPKPLNVSSLVLGYLETLKNLPFVTFSIILGLCSVLNYCYSLAAPLYTHQILDLSPGQYGTWNILSIIGMFFSSVLSTYFIKRFDVSKTLYIGLVLILFPLVSFITLAFSASPTALWFFISSLFFYLFIGLLFPTGSYFAMDVIEDKANASGMMSFINMGTATLSVIVLGFMSISIMWGFILTFLTFYLISIILLIIVKSMPHKVANL